MTNDKKSSSGGFVTFVVLTGAAVYAGPKIWDAIKPASKVRYAPSSSPMPWRRPVIQPEPPTDPMGQCLHVLGNCAVVNPCPVREARALLQRRRLSVDAEDTASATMLEVCERATAQDTPEDWKAALMKRVWWRQLDFYRRKTRDCFLDAQDDLFRDDNEQLESDHLADRRLKAALCRLEPRDRCVIEARYFDDKNDDAIVAECGMTSTAMVRKQLERARQRLKAEMTRNDNRPNLKRAWKKRLESAHPSLGGSAVPRYDNSWPTAQYDYDPPQPALPTIKQTDYDFEEGDD